MIKGGDQIIDFTGLTEFDGTETIPGAFNKIKTAGKPILVNNLVGSYGYTHDIEPTNTSAAILPFITVVGGSPTILRITISSSDAVSLS